MPAHLRAGLEAKAKEARLPFDDFAIQCMERYKRSGPGVMRSLYHDLQLEPEMRSPA
jgi:hypothetical protein